MIGVKSNIQKLFVPRNKLLVFNLHQSTPSFDPAKNDKWIWSELDFFKSQMKFLKDNYEILKLDYAIKQLRAGHIRGTKVAITFDDGDISVQDYIVPLLSEMKIPATFFVNTAYFSNEKKGYWYNINNFLNSDRSKYQKHLTAEYREIANKLRNTTNPEFYRKNYKKIEDLSVYIKENVGFYAPIGFWENLDADLFSIGLHGHEHQRFSMMSKTWQKNDLLRNINVLSKFETYKPIFAVPFGKPCDWNNDTIELCKKLGLEIAFANKGYNVTHNLGILRIPIDGLEISSMIASLHPFIKRYYR